MMHTTVLGLGHDVVDVAAFSRQLDEAGAGARGLFSAREWRQAEMCAVVRNDARSMHLAAKWAGKEAVLKAWSEALGEQPMPYAIENFPWADIEILDDSRGRPRVVIDSAVENRLRDSLRSQESAESSESAAATAASSASPQPVWHISLSHDGPIASAVVMLMAA